MDDEIDEMIVSVRADTRAFAADMQQMRGTLDSTLVDGFDQAGKVLERSLLAAIRKGGLAMSNLGPSAGTPSRRRRSVSSSRCSYPSSSAAYHLRAKAASSRRTL